MALFLSTVINRVDRKGRISVPAAFRAALAGQPFQGIVAVPAFKFPALHCGGMDWMERLSASIDEFDLFSDDRDNLTAAMLSSAQPLSFDSDGRILLPAALLAHGNITGHAAFVGRGPLFEIWEPEAFADHQGKARRKLAEKGLTLKSSGAAGATP